MTKNVYPSLGDFATCCVPTLPAAPVLLSINTDCLRTSVNLAPTILAAISTGPPGGNETTIFIGFSGYAAIATPEKLMAAQAIPRLKQTFFNAFFVVFILSPPFNEQSFSLWKSDCIFNYLIAKGLVGDPTAPVIGIAGATNINS